MIYVLFGPPGVGKTYIGALLSRRLKVKFFDADVLFDDEFRSLLREGKFRQEDRDRFFNNLKKVTEHLLSDLKEGQDLLIAQAFIKDKNRDEFLHRFDEQVKYVLIEATRNLAHLRFTKRLENEPDHVVNEDVFDYSWDQFETPKVPHVVMKNMDLENDALVQEFKKLIESR